MWFILLSQFTSYTFYFTLSVNYKVSERQQRTTTANALYLLSCKSVCDKELTPIPFPGFSLSEYIFCFKIYSKIQLISFIHTNACPYPVIVQSIPPLYSLIFNRQCRWIIRVEVRHMQVVVITSYFKDVDKKCVKFM